MGFATCGILGAKLAQPESPAVAVVGDGSFLMSRTSRYRVEYDSRRVIRNEPSPTTATAGLSGWASFAPRMPQVANPMDAKPHDCSR